MERAEFVRSERVRGHAMPRQQRYAFFQLNQWIHIHPACLARALALRSSLFPAGQNVQSIRNRSHSVPHSARAQTKQRPTCLRNCSNRRTRFVSIIAAIRALGKNPAAVNWLALCTLGFQGRFSLGAMPPPLALRCCSLLWVRWIFASFSCEIRSPTGGGAI